MTEPEMRLPAQAVALDHVTHRYDGVPALHDLSLTIRPGEMFGLLGPSGCGKTTTLRIVAGFIRPDAGAVRFGTREVTFLPPERRQIGMVFQNYALFPHMTVFDNVAFGLVARRVPKGERQRRVSETLALVQMQGMERRSVADLSGGQQQRVALARALVVEPTVLLLDEPLSNLDARLRERTGAELRSLQQRLGITTIYVTHDQTEALTLCDRIAVMRAGTCEQVGTPEELFLAPQTGWVADFLGRANLLPVDDLTPHGDGWTARVGPLRIDGTAKLPSAPVTALALRPHAVSVLSPEVDRPGVGNIFSAQVRQRRFLGADVELTLTVGPLSLVAHLRPHDSGAATSPGASVSVHIPPEALWPVST